MSSQAAAADGDRGRYIVVFEDSVAAPAKLARTQAANRDGRLGFVYRGAPTGYSAVLPKGAVDGLRRSPRVRAVRPDHPVVPASQVVPTGVERTFATSNDLIDIDGEDDVRADVDIAIIDTGTDHEHPDLDVVARTDCSNGTKEEAECVDDSGTDLFGHGTHVAGTAAAIDNGEGVVGVAPGARIWAVKVLNPSGWESEIVAGVQWVTAHAAQIEVANMSIGCSFLPCNLPSASEAISESAEAGVVYTISAGNNAGDAKHSDLATNPDSITVSALADFDGKPGGEAESPVCEIGEYEFSWGEEVDETLANFSNYGKDVEVAAPGFCIRSTVPGGNYAEQGWWGTSMAAPHVAGAAALLAAKDNPEGLGGVTAIRATIKSRGNSGWEDTSGDEVTEPLLDVGDESTFGILPFLQPPPDFIQSVGGAGSGAGQLNEPLGVATDAEGDIWVADSYNHRVQQFSPDGEQLSEFGEQGTGEGQLYLPTGIAIDAEGDVWVSSSVNNRVKQFSPEGEQLSQFGGAGVLKFPTRLAIDAGGDVWVVDSSNNRVKQFSPEGEQLGEVGQWSELDFPTGVAIDAEGDIWVADSGNDSVLEFSPAGAPLSGFGEAGSEAGQLDSPGDVAIDAEGDVWVTEQGNDRVQAFTPAGESLTVFGGSGSGSGQFDGPAGIAIGPDRDFWVADAGNDRVQNWAYERSAFQSEDSPVALTGSGGGQAFSVGTLGFQCSSAALSGSAATPAASVGLTPTYSSCELGNGAAANFSANGCELALIANAYSGEEKEITAGALGVDCPAGKSIQIAIPLYGCTIAIGPQAATLEVDYTNTGTGSEREIEMDLSGGGLTAVGTGSCFGATGEQTLTYAGGGFTLSGTDEAEEQSGVWVETLE